MAQAHFLTLPCELRLMVLDYLVPETLRVKDTRRAWNGGEAPYTHQVAQPLTTFRLLATCAQVRAEVFDYLRSRKPIFSVRVDDAPRLLRLFGARSAVIRRLAISRMNLRPVLRRPFDIPVKMLRECRKLRMDESVEELELCLQLTKEFVAWWVMAEGKSPQGEQKFMHALASLGRFKKVRVAWGGSTPTLVREAWNYKWVTSEVERTLKDQLLVG